MKYIRTNLNEIYCLDDFTKSDKMVDCYVAKYFHRCINKNDIVATANNIEELCDCFVAVQTYQDGLADYDVYYNGRAGDFRYWFSEEISDGWTIYGAIHIKDKGLIYVAKTNDKGELELL